MEADPQLRLLQKMLMDALCCSADFAVLHAWDAMPGWIAATEVLYRGKHQASRLLEAGGISYLSSKSIMLISGSNDASNIKMHLSLAATARKVLWPHVQHEGRTDTGKAGPGARMLPASDRSQWHFNQLKMMDVFCDMNLLGVLLHAVSKIDSLHASSNGSSSRDGSGCGSGGSIAGRIPNSTASNASSSSVAAVFLAEKYSRFQHKKTSGSSGNGSSSSQDATGSGMHLECSALVDHTSPLRVVGTHTYEHGSQSEPHSHVLPHVMLHRLQAVSLLTLVQACLWMKECGMTRNGFQYKNPRWLAMVTDVCDKLQIPGLRHVGTSLMSDISASVLKSQAEVNVVWEQYAVTHLHGRILPGCCNLNCTNLEGVGETALKTKLCSGCNKARYCSVACQRKAWLEGGHSTVCKK